MAVTQIGDPRLEALFGAEPREIGVRPVVRLRRSGASASVIAAFALAAAMLLFWVLTSGRDIQPQPALRENAATRQFAPEPPPLYIPPTQVVERPYYPQMQTAGPPVIIAPSPLPQPRTTVVPQPSPVVYAPSPPEMMPPPALSPSRTAGGAALVIDTTAPSAQAGSTAAPGLPGPAARSGGRIRASALASRSDTVAQGVLIPAVLETAFDSTRAGFARAIVSRDVRSFDGTKVLIPRGSRLVGEYQSDVAPGQKRALITWTRLVRPDGMMIALNSPATDTLGRGGVRAAVNSHFMERFFGALLRTTVDIGGSLATRAATGSVIVALPGTVQQTTAPAQPNRIVPTLSIRAGTSISIFVARDLEFALDGARR